MSYTVFILGAGASAAAGVPVMSTFLDSAEELMRSQKLGSDQTHFERVFRGISELQSVYAKSTIDSNNLESVFVAFEMAQLLGSLGRLSLEDLQNLTVSMKRVIVRTIEERMLFTIHSATKKVGAPVEYQSLVKYVKMHLENTAILTFNYDYGLDMALVNESIPIDYCLDGPCKVGSVPVLKLHGSLLWRHHDEKVIPVEIPSSIFRSEVQPFWHGDGNDATRLCLTTNGQAMDKPAFESVIVPPSWNKAQHRQGIQNVWRSAATYLNRADHIIVSGFSLPSTDEFFKYLFALGTVGEQRLKAFWICEKNPTSELNGRFRSLLGPQAISRYMLAPMDFRTMARWVSGHDGLNGLSREMNHAIGEYRQRQLLFAGPYQQSRNQTLKIGGITMEDPWGV